MMKSVVNHIHMSVRI